MYHASRIDSRKFVIVDDEGFAQAHNGEVVRFNEHDAREIAAALNNGVELSIFFGSDADDDYYGSPAHAANGDAWFYQNCEGAW